MGDGGGAEPETKSVRATASDDGDGASTPPPKLVPPVEQQPAPSPVAASADGGSAAAAAAAAAARSCGEDDEDEQKVETFYALIANIRALRGLYSAGDAGGSGSLAAGHGRKRAREAEAEAPWRPAFRLEDFEEDVNQGTADARRGVTTNQDTSGGAARPPAADRARAAAVAEAEGEADDHEGDGVAEAARGGNKLRRRVAARG